MSYLVIKKNIQRLLKERDWKVADVENQLGNRSVTSILRGSSKNPSLAIVKSIADAFEVDVQELLIDLENINILLNINLLRDTCDKVLDILTQHSNTKYPYALAMIKEIYEYSSKLKLDVAEPHYVQWTVEKYIANKEES